ncbi:hypothetical protein AVEN_24262-1 [Araneus ventricosus]|uniref:Uncharacterized protein n=1 Tax=Araneus ventricosus TaxID=182803 RepID=A0A4Y2LMD3_ARAVE|nr:hypothetical protein AVEN_24262-1 [Araneus ventricosus]
MAKKKRNRATKLQNIYQSVCEQDQAIIVHDSNGDECVEEHSPKNAEMKQELDILKLGILHRLTNFKKQYKYEQYIIETGVSMDLEVPDNEECVTCSEQGNTELDSNVLSASSGPIPPALAGTKFKPMAMRFL